MKSALVNLLARLLEPFTPDLSSLVLDLEPGDVLADLEHGRDDEEGLTDLSAGRRIKRQIATA